MNLVVSGSDTEQRTQAWLRFERLFKELGLRSGELATLRDNLQRADEAMKSASPESGDAPLLPRRFDQLAWLGVTAETLEVLRPYVTVLPVGGQVTPVNLNTASALVIYAAIPQLDPATAQRLVSQRERKFFQTTREAADVARLNESDLAGWVSVDSSFFEVRGRLRLDDVALEEVSVVQRNAPGRPGVLPLWRERAALTVPLTR